MHHLEHKVKVNELVIRRVPWEWLIQEVGERGTQWRAVLEHTDAGPYLIVSFKNKEDAVRFTLTWC